jgi:hypothetical protein
LTLSLATAFVLMGCGREAVVQSELPLRRVVIYRNGIAYFERAGHVEQDQVRFKMKSTEVGDFLATLAVMESGKSSVRAAAFPLKMDKDNEDAKTGKPLDKNRLETVVLSLDGRVHDLQVGYVAEAPVWRPSYRVVVQPNGEADLQAWGIVQNLSGEDWSNVQLSLVAGAPIAFEAQLGRPVIPQRPVVTDLGEVMAIVPRGETTLASEEQEGKKNEGGTGTRAKGDEVAAAEAGEDYDGVPSDKPAKQPPATGARHRGPGAAPAPAAPPPPPPPSMMPRNIRSLAAVAAQGGTTRYDIPDAISVPDKSATMVMLIAKRVRGESVLLFAPDDGVPESTSHPFRVVRFANATGGILERGPIAVFEKGSFLGEGMLDPLPAGASATVPFALERSLAIDSDRKGDETGERVARIENSQLTVERDSRVQTTYRVRNGSDETTKLVVKHPRVHGSRLFQPPEGTDDQVGAGSALVPVSVASKQTATLVVDERSTVERWEDWFSDIAESAVKNYLANPSADKTMAPKLQAAWALRDEVKARRIAKRKIDVEMNDIARGMDQTRSSLRAIEKSKGKEVEELRAKLTKGLNEMVAREEVLRREGIENNLKLTEVEVRFREAIREIKISAPLPPPTQ